MTGTELYRLDSAEKRWPVTEYLIEATHEEAFNLWRETHETIKWEQGHGWTFTIGEVELRKPGAKRFKRMPAAVCVIWNLLDGHPVCFYEATSLVVDYAMVADWIRAKCPKHTNATNFHHCAHDLGLKLRAA